MMVCSVNAGWRTTKTNRGDSIGAGEPERRENEGQEGLGGSHEKQMRGKLIKRHACGGLAGFIFIF